MQIKRLRCNPEILSRTGVVCYGVGCALGVRDPVNRFIAVLLSAVLSCSVAAADKPAKARAVSADFTKDGDPNVKSSGVLVLDPVSGQTLFSRNADQALPIASLTKLMTAMVVLDAKLAMDQAIEITSEDIDTVKNTKSRLPIGSHFRRDDLLRLALMA